MEQVIKYVGHGVLRSASTLKAIKVNKISPITESRCPEGSRELRYPDYVTMAQDGGNVVSLTHQPLLSPGNTPCNHFC